MKRILFRADAKPSIGTGDLMSLVHLSSYFEKGGWETHFIIKKSPAALALTERNRIKSLFVLGEEISLEREIEQINSYIEDKEIDIVFFEITEKKITEYRGITNRALKACVNFDGAIPEDMDLVVNWDVHADKIFDTLQYPRTKFLLGPKYVILPDNFDFTEISNRIYRSSIEKVLIAMGGVDEFNFTKKIAEVLLRNCPDLKLIVIVGSGYQFLEDLETSLGKLNSAGYSIKQNITNMFNEFMTCDVAIAGGGLTSFELIASRTPAILIAIYEHQVSRCIYFDTLRWAKYLGFRDFNENVLLRNVRNPNFIPPREVFQTEEIIVTINELYNRH